MSKDLGSRSSVRSLRDITRVDYKSLHQGSHYPGGMSDNEIHEATTDGQAESMPLQGASGGPGDILIPGDSPRAESPAMHRKPRSLPSVQFTIHTRGDSVRSHAFQVVVFYF